MTTEIPKPETNFRRTTREVRESQERLATEMAKSPQHRAMRDALKLTHGESERLAKAEAKLTEAEQAVGRIVGEMQAVSAGRVITQRFVTRDGRPLIRRLLDPKVQAKEAAELPELKAQLVEARLVLDAAHKRRNAVLGEVNAARMARRKAAKIKLAPKPVPATRRGDWWSSMDRISGDKDVA